MLWVRPMHLLFAAFWEIGIQREAHPAADIQNVSTGANMVCKLMEAGRYSGLLAKRMPLFADGIIGSAMKIGIHENSLSG